MRVPPQQKLEKFDQWLILLSLIGVMAFLYFLYDESWLIQNRSGETQVKIGSVHQLKYDVRRRFQEDFVWLPIGELTTVFLGDSIFTGSQSAATIRLDSGVDLWIDADSLVVLDQTTDLLKLDLRFGNLRGTFSADAKAPLKINVDNRDLDLVGKSMQFFLEKGKKAETRLRVTEGIAKIVESKSKKELTVSKSQGVKLNRSIASVDTPLVVTPEIVFVRQEQWGMHRNVWFAQKQALHFTWDTEGRVDHFEFELSRKFDMRQLLLKEELKVNGFEWLPPFDEGTLYWRVKAYGAPGTAPIESEVVQWNVGLLLPPEWQALQNPMHLRPADWSGSGESVSNATRVQWKSPLKAALYRLEWSLDPKFLDRQSLEVKETFVNLPKLSVGRYFFRARSEALGRPGSLWSNPLVVEVSEKDPDGLLAPSFEIPDIETLERVETPKLSWVGQEKTSTYAVELSDRADFSKVLESVQVKSTDWSTKARPLGEYFVRIFPLAANGRRGPVSPVIQWHSRYPGPRWKQKEPIMRITMGRNKKDEVMAFPKTNLAWVDQSSLKVKEYRLETDANAEFKSFKEESLTKNSTTLMDLKPGEYYYRVRSHFADGKVSVASKILKVEVAEQQADGLVPPKILSKNLEGALVGDATAAIKVVWDQQPSARKYKIQWSENEDFKTTIGEKVLPTNDTQIPLDRAGAFYARVAGISQVGRVGPWSGVAAVKIKMGAPIVVPMDAIKVTVPNSQSPLPPTYLKVRWKAAKGLKSFKLEVADDEKFSKIVFSEVVKGWDQKVRLPNPGKYRIRVTGVGANGNPETPVSKVEQAKFYIYRPLVPPELVLPKDKVSYILSKMKNPQIWLEWTSDKLATQYVVEFAKDKGFKKVAYTLQVKDKRILLDHNAVRGKLYWRVRAFNEEQGLESPWSQSWVLSVVDIESED